MRIKPNNNLRCNRLVDTICEALDDCLLETYYCINDVCITSFDKQWVHIKLFASRGRVITRETLSDVITNLQKHGICNIRIPTWVIAPTDENAFDKVVLELPYPTTVQRVDMSFVDVKDDELLKRPAVVEFIEGLSRDPQIYQSIKIYPKGEDSVWISTRFKNKINSDLRYRMKKAMVNFANRKFPSPSMIFIKSKPTLQ